VVPDFNGHGLRTGGGVYRRQQTRGGMEELGEGKVLGAGKPRAGEDYKGGGKFVSRKGARNF